METVHIDDRVMVRAELVRVKQERQAHEEKGQELLLEAGRVIRKARDLGVTMEEAVDLAGFHTRGMGYKLIDRLERHEAGQRVA